jgi:DNA-binding NtrC family response regulator
VSDPDKPPETLHLEPAGGGFALRLVRLRLTVVSGPDAGTELVPDSPQVRIGTHPDMDLVLTDPSVSRLHCELVVKGPLVRVRDRGSTNGTFEGAVRIHDAEVPPGTVLRLGETSLRIGTEGGTVKIPLSSRHRFGALLGRSARMREVFAILERVAPTETTVLVEGESGTGKELAAEGIHAASPRADGPFVVFDAGAVAHDLLESELFGHVRGAFTGAVADRPGVFEEASGGTLFLDEIGELPLDLQPKLLRAIEKREVRPLGSTDVVTVDVRLVAATNRSLESEVNAGRFREDLYWRLAVVRVELPPLRARPEDVPLLAEHFLRRIAPDAEPFEEGVLAALATRPWPGNVRELRNAIERAVTLGATSDLAAFEGPVLGRETATDVSLPFHDARERALAAFERAYVERALAESGGNVSAAARAIGVNRRFLHRLLRKHRLRGGDDE